VRGGVRGRRQDKRVVRPVRNMVAGRHALARPSHCRRRQICPIRLARFGWCRCRCANIETTVLSTCRRRWPRRSRTRSAGLRWNCRRTREQLIGTARKPPSQRGVNERLREKADRTLLIRSNQRANRPVSLSTKTGPTSILGPNGQRSAVQ